MGEKVSIVSIVYIVWYTLSTKLHRNTKPGKATLVLKFHILKTASDIVISKNSLKI